MKAKSLKRYRRPGYPVRLQVLSHPDLLRLHTPPAWRAVPEMAGAAALFLATNTTICRGADKANQVPNATALVAPIFAHGEGRGATGCIVVAPPAFLSEEEAIQVIMDELAKHKVTLSQPAREMKGVRLPLAEYFQDESGRTTIRPRPEPPASEPFKVDRADASKPIAVEFLSQGDFRRLCGHTVKTASGGWSLSSVQVYDFKNLANVVAERVQKESTEKVFFGTFYDPCGRIEVASSPPREQPVPPGKRVPLTRPDSAESKRLLRLQVQDFVKWLQGQGAI